MLFHWTLVLPLAAGIGAAQLFLVVRGRMKWTAIAGALALFFAAATAYWAIIPDSVPLAEIFFPGKAQTGWVAFTSEKVLNALVGVGNAFSGGFNTTYAATFTDGGVTASIVPYVVLSWIAASAALATCVWIALQKPAALALRALMIFALVQFAVSEAEAIYSQPSDPQLQLQPMFLLTAALIGAAAYWNWRPAVAAGLAALALANGASNLRLMISGSPADEDAIAAVTEMVRTFPFDRSFYVSSGWDGWVTWAFVLNFPGQRATFENENAFLYSPFTNRSGTTVAEAVEEMRTRIDAQLDGGQRVVAASLWQEPRARFINPLSSVIDPARASDYADRMAALYTPGRKWELANGTFVELRKSASR